MNLMKLSYKNSVIESIVYYILLHQNTKISGSLTPLSAVISFITSGKVVYILFHKDRIFLVFACCVQFF